jgi:hypothetical protein
LVREVIQRRPEIRKHVGRLQAQGFGDWVDPSDVVDALAGLRIFLDANLVGIGFIEGAEPRVEVVKVLFGPCNFRANAVSKIHG